MRTYIAILTLMLGKFGLAQKQIDSAKELMAIPLGPMPIVIQMEHSRNLVATEIQKVNPSASLTSLLSKQSGIYIRRNGASGLSTPSYKGLGSLQIPIVIDGANIQSPMNGNTDLNLIHPFHFQSLRIHNSTENIVGSVNQGGSIQLNSHLGRPGVELNSSINSLANHTLGFKVQEQKKHWTYGISVFNEQGLNRFSLSQYDRSDKQQNADFNRTSLLLRTQFESHKKLTWFSTIHVMKSEAGIPRTLVDNSQSRQEDFNSQFINRARFKLSSITYLEVVNMTGFQRIVFDDQIDPTTTSDVLSSNSTVTLHRRLNDQWVSDLGFANEKSFYSSEALEGRVNWDRYRSFLRLDRKGYRSQLSTEIGVQPYDGKLRTHARLAYAKVYRLRYTMNAEVQKVYRLPTLNELYWYEPGRAFGNSELDPENGFRLDFTGTFSGRRLFLNVNPHIGRYQNWVEWRGFPIIRPQNVRNVAVAGTVVSGTYNCLYKKYKFITQLNYHWVRSVYAPKLWFNSEQNQLIFTPQHSGSVTLTCVAPRFSIYTNLQLVGENFITTDNSNSLSAFSLLDIGGYYAWKKWRPGISIENLLNTPYFTQPNSPLPGRVLTININYQIPI